MKGVDLKGKENILRLIIIIIIIGSAIGMIGAGPVLGALAKDKPSWFVSMGIMGWMVYMIVVALLAYFSPEHCNVCRRALFSKYDIGSALTEDIMGDIKLVCNRCKWWYE
ncbi:MAG: hypothetical protein QMC77_05485 [Methanocellales archaeon]|nr:hypothetical protein [Methanocellales archaeon]